MLIQDTPIVAGAQQSAQWFQERIGKLTASSMAAAMDFLKNGQESAKRRDLKISILAERMTDIIREVYVNAAMEWGNEQEANAKLLYTEQTGTHIMPAPFFAHPTIENFGASPDGLLEANGLLEVKCPTTPTYLKWVMGGGVPDEHKPQMLAQLACTGRAWVEFVAFDPRMPEKRRMFIRRFQPDKAEVKAVEDAAIKFLDEVDAMFDVVCQEPA
jgi:putative phage-type endonuclease